MEKSELADNHVVKVLLIDDDLDDTLLFEEAVKELSTYPVLLTQLNDASLLGETLEKDFFDIIFLDMIMPKRNGYECFEQIRKHELHLTTPVIIYTGVALNG